jgi:hypothetical protein
MSRIVKIQKLRLMGLLAMPRTWHS